MRDLDAEWSVKHPPKSQEQRTFRWLGVDVVRLPEMPIAAFDEIENQPPAQTGEQPGDSAAPRRRNEMRAIIAAVRQCLDPVCHANYDHVTSTPACTVERLMNLWEVLVAETMARPTQQPADSSGGQSTNGTPSTDGPATTEVWTSGGLVPGASPT